MTSSQSTSTPPTALVVEPFRVDVPQPALDDLAERLARTRFPAEVPGDDWSQGTPVPYLREMVHHWRTDFDWRQVERRINALPHHLTEIDGQRIHFVHVRSADPDAVPLLLTHTYPGSFLDFLDLVGPLSDPAGHGAPDGQAFHLVVPSLPGFGFSTPLADGGWTVSRVARAWDALMRGLGYDSYLAHGSDLGAMVSRELAATAPPGFLGAHVLQLFSFPSGDPSEFEAMSPEDHEALEFAAWFQTVNGYAAMNASRPSTVAAALSDSPVGQLAYHELFENFGRGTSLLTREQVLAQVSLYWLTNTSAGAVRIYHAERSVEPRTNHGPIGVTVFADDFRSMRPFAERDNTDIVSWTTRPRGGHFASLEVPKELAEEIRDFYAVVLARR
ncbi:alpha/beta fold hydrolase [Auraticoccus sp. F435]|uniref:Alpha/beta fold hydrolase n=1 Tax=Auraticoccus cholistanensis TaxID=2656650 RepID=A0A6A9UW98_9ACTN|nr:epoxide hydrolase family protein [Auraticoccus cholistanensis]MVA75854.1 alpha/beta fold hydrolase [Auraticoccus cholistanensis]